MKKELRSRIFCASLLILLVAQNQASSLSMEPASAPQSSHQMYGEGSLQPEDCGPRCTDRCSATAFKKPCLFFCRKCCATCLCVPPGTYGNKQMCPCYNNWKTKRGGPKCP
uniref:Uncharacterized protein n=1 Tax=Kalanchoe fedtschenkoi TaxID=63787 RepID=A0A7N0TAJ1_KALFE